MHSTFATLTDLVVHRAGLQPAKLAFRFLEYTHDGMMVHEWTYADLDAHARAMAVSLGNAVSPGDRTLILLPPGLDFVAAFFGCLYAGVVAVPVPPPNAARPEKTAARLQAIAENSRPSLVLTTPTLFARRSVVLEGFPGAGAPRCMALDCTQLPDGDGWRRPDIDDQSMAFLQYTSGSTGLPRGVVNRHASLLANEVAIAEIMGSDADTHVVGWLPLFHDMGLIGNLLHPVFVGGCCTFMAPADFLKRPLRWLKAISDYRGTISGGPNFAYDLCVDKIPADELAPLDLRSWCVAYNGAEPVRARTLDRFAERFAPAGFRAASFTPCYGLAEATLYVSGARQRREAEPASDAAGVRPVLSMGRPSAGHEILVVDPQTCTPCEDGQVGEIWYGGPSVAAGYFGHPNESEVTFRARAAMRPDATFLRTGDLGFKSDGDVFVTGRVKDLIIVRGRNLYPQDVEAAIEGVHPAVCKGGVAAFAVKAEEDELLTLVIEIRPRAGAAERDALLETVKSTIAEEFGVLPHTIVLTRPNRIPKTSSGKVRRGACRDALVAGALEIIGSAVADRTAAPALGIDESPGLVADLGRVDRQQQRRRLMGDLVRGELARRLGVAEGSISPDASIIALGVDSLMLMELQAHFENTLDVSLPTGFGVYQPHFDHVVDALIDAWEQRDRPVAAVSIRSQPPQPECHASSGQERIYLLQRLADGVPVYNVHVGVDLDGVLDVPNLLAAFRELTRRHAALRTTFCERDGRLYQVVAPEAGVALDRVDLSPTAPGLLDDAVEARSREQQALPFDLEVGPLMRAELVQLAPTRHRLLVTQHHLITDGWSIGRMVADLARLYRAGMDGTPAPAVPVVDYLDFARWEREGGYAATAARSFWARQLDGLPHLNLPADRPPPSHRSYRGGSVPCRIEAALAERLARLVREEGCTLFSGLLAAYALLLRQYSGQDAFGVGTVVANRRPEVQETLGLFVNTVVIRCDMNGSPSFRQLLRRLSGTVATSMRHADLPFAEVVASVRPERAGDVSQLFNASFVWEGEGRTSFSNGEMRWTLVTLAPDGAVEGTAKFDLSLSMRDDGNGLAGAFEYSSDHFVEQSIRRMVATFIVLLDAVTVQPDLPADEIELTSAGERATPYGCNGTTIELPSDLLAHQVFERQVALTPLAVAATDPWRSVTFGELNEQANRVAHRLKASGVGPNTLVALLMPRGIDFLTSMLAVFKAGGAYVPLDPEHPPARNTSVLRQSGATCLIACGATLEAVALDVPGVDVRLVEDLRADDPGALSAPCPNPPLASTLRDLAYVIFTSGSTGTPKGAMVEHAGMLNHLHAKLRDLALTARDVVVQNAPQSFDISVWQFLSALLVGGQVDIVDAETATDARLLFEHVSQRRATVLELVPSLLRAALDRLDHEELGSFDVPALRWLVLTGEALPPALVHRWFAGHVGVPIMNAYGPTECSDDVAHFVMSDGATVQGSVTPIGRPIINTRLHVLNRAMRPVPLGAVGELYVGGAGVGRGYLGDPARTATSFVPDPFSDRASERLYRTGDVVRLSAEEQLVFLGRRDEQVKVRGFRIELGDVQAAFEQLREVRAVVIVAAVDRQGDKQLAAYVKLRQPSTSAAIRAALQDRLPRHMIPAAVVILEALPLTPNGKIDRRALPPVTWGEGGTEDGGYVAPSGPVEELVAQAWAEVLGLSRVSATADFFELGGHSLLATQVVARVRRSLGVELPVRALFERPTVSGLAALVVGAPGRLGPAITRVARSSPLPASFAQRRLWFLEQLAPGSAVYNVAGAVRIEGPLDTPALHGAMCDVVARHEALRTRFVAEDGEPRQVVEAASDVPLPIVEPAEDVAWLSIARAEAARPFDLERGPLLRATLVRLLPQVHVLVVVMHHIVSDGWSLGVLMRELSAFYEARAGGAPAELAPLAIQYVDYSAWQRAHLSGPQLQEQLVYWRQRLAGAPGLALATDRPRRAWAGGAGAQLPVRLDPELAAGAAALARRHGATLYMVLLAAYQVLLGRYAGQDDFCIGTPVAGRTLQETEGLVGLFVNTLVLRADLSGGPDFAAVLGRVKAATLEAYAHQDVPFERLVEDLAPERDLARTPLFEAMFVLQNAPRAALTLGTQRLVQEPLDTGTAKFSLTLALEEAADGGLEGFVEYATDLFDAATAARLAAHYARVLAAAVAAPATPVGRLLLLEESERRQLQTWGTGPEVPYPACGVHELVERRVAQSPDALALVDGERRLSYRALDAAANRLAHALRRRGVGRGARVGVAIPRSAEAVAAMWGTMKLGAAYVPLDPNYPAERLRSMADLADLACVVADGGPIFTWNGEWLDVRSDEVRQASDARVSVATDPDDLAYVVFTSGSTGEPKGVLGMHRGVVNRASWMEREFPFVAGERSALKTSTSFVDAVWETFGPLIAGIPSVIFSKEIVTDVERFIEGLAVGAVTRIVLVPSLLRAMLDTAPDLGRRLPRLHHWTSSGEALDENLVAVFRAALPGRTLLNLYGSSEAAGDSTYEVVDAGCGVVSIGRPIDNTRIFVLDRALQPVPVGVRGEIYIGGDGLAGGYLFRPALTAERFLPNPFSVVPGARLYRTFDLGRYRQDGTIELVGRADRQVKIRGMAIDLREVELAFGQDEHVRQVVVELDRAPSGNRLLAYVALRDGIVATGRELQTRLADRLPRHMIPAAVVILEALPLTPNGKIDRRALPPVTWGEGGTEDGGYVAPSGPVEELVAQAWAEVLGLSRVSATADFFELGGHSLLATQVVARVRRSLGVELPVRALFERPTVSGLAALVVGAPGRLGPAITRVARSSPLPASFAQRRLWFLEQLAPGSAVYNVAGAVRIEGPLDTPALHGAMCDVVARHEALRTRFVAEDGEPRQVVEAASDVPLPIVEPAEDVAWLSIARAEAARPFDLERGPLLRATLVRLLPQVHVLVVVMHHIVSDGWSLGVLMRELSAFYEARAGGAPAELAPLAIQYVDYSAWQRAHLSGPQLQEQLVYWRQRLAGAPGLALATDRPRRAWAGGAGAQLPVRLDPELAAGAAALARRHGATLYMVLLAAYQVLLGRYAGQDDFCIGTPVAGRTLQETEGLVGLFVNTLVLRADLSGGPDFAAVLGRVKAATLEAYAHQDVPFERLVEDLAPERDLARTPLFEAMFVLQNAPRAALTLGTQRLVQEPLDTGTAKFSLTLALEEAADGGLEGFVEYATDLFDAATAARLAAHYARVLAAAVAAPATPVGRLLLLEESERRQLQTWGTGPEVPYPACGVHELVERRVAQSPDALALVDGERRLSYRALDAAANRLAHALRRRGVGRGARVGILLERSAETVIGLLAVLKAGGTYVPLDPDFPDARLDFMLKDAGVEITLVQQRLTGRLWSGAPFFALDSSLPEIARESDEPLPAVGTPDDPVYLMHTSGSTGRPKAAVVSHAGVVCCISAMQELHRLDETDRFLLRTSLNFDPSVWEVFWPLSVGAAIVVATPLAQASPEALSALVEQERITTLYLVPSMLRSFLECTNLVLTRSLRKVICGGEKLTPETIRLFFQRCAAQLHHSYGPTETSIAATEWTCVPNSTELVAMGRPLPNVRAYVLDAEMALLPAGIPGELYIGGGGVGLGYADRPALTAERFVPDGLSGSHAGRLYRTGDKVRWLPDGQLEFLGRLDDQVKIRGHRIELGEVERVLEEHPAVAQAVAVVGEIAAERHLVAYVVLRRSMAEPDLREFVKLRLPTSMLPSAVVPIEAIPLMPNGKVDRKALPRVDARNRKAFVAPRDAMEAALAAMWAEVLPVGSVGVDDDFFELGGHSLLATKLLGRVNQAFDVDLPLRELFERRTVATLARVVVTARAESPARQPAIARVARRAVGRPTAD